MPTHLIFNLDTVAIASTASGVAPADLVVTIAIVQAVATASHEHAVTAEAVLQQEKAVVAATTSGDATNPVDLTAALTALQMCVATTEAEAQQVWAAATALELQLTDVLSVVATTEAEAQQVWAVATALELQLTDVLSVIAPPPPGSATPAPRGTTSVGGGSRVGGPVATTFEASSVGYLHTQSASTQDIRSLVPVVLGVTSTQYPRWHDLMLLML
jgi:hypothetical protein